MRQLFGLARNCCLDSGVKTARALSQSGLICGERPYATFAGSKLFSKIC
jgi:hypothetical protein